MAVVIAALLAVSWQAWHSQRLIRDLRAELGAARADRANLAVRLQEQERLAANLLWQAHVEREAYAAVAGDRPLSRIRPAPWSAEGLIYQPAMTDYALRARALDRTPGSTSWRRSDLTLPVQFTGPHSTWRSPGALVAGLVNALNLASWASPEGDQRLTIRVLMPGAGQASATILQWGFLDDVAHAS